MSEQPINPEVTSDDKLWALLAYALSPIVPIIIMLMEDKKNRPFLRAHNAQALVWGLLNVVIVSLFTAFLCGIPTLIVWGVGVFWGIKAYKGEYVNIPVITDFCKKQKWA